MKKLVMAMVWAVVFYLGASFLLGFYIGFDVGMREKDPQVGQRLVTQAVEKAINDYLPYLVGGSLTLAVLGSFAGILPGTRE